MECRRIDFEKRNMKTWYLILKWIMNFSTHKIKKYMYFNACSYVVFQANAISWCIFKNHLSYYVHKLLLTILFSWIVCIFESVIYFVFQFKKKSFSTFSNKIVTICVNITVYWKWVGERNDTRLSEKQKFSLSKNS